MPDPEDAVPVVAPTSVRRVDTPNATRLAGFVAAYDDLQTTLQCCERLMAMLDKPEGGPDGLGIEALWTLALLSYARAFADNDGDPAVTEADLDDSAGDGEILRRHRVLMHLRDHHASPATNPREVYTVGVAQDDAGAVAGVAVTSVRSPSVDVDAVRQAGAIAYPLCTSLDGRITALQEVILTEIGQAPRTELEAMDVIEVVAVG